MELTDLSGTPFFQSHGSEDTILSLSDGEELYKLLRASGLLGELLVFDGDHTIGQEALLAAHRFIREEALR